MQPASLPLASSSPTAAPPSPASSPASSQSSSSTTPAATVGPVVAETAEQQPPAPQQAPPQPLFAGLRSTMERNAHQWRSNFSQMVLRPLQQHASQQQQHQQSHRGASSAAAGTQLQPQQQQQQQLGAQQMQLHQPPAPLALSASHVANNLLHAWMPHQSSGGVGIGPAAAAAAQPPLAQAQAHSRPASVIINLDARGGGADAADAASASSAGPPSIIGHSGGGGAANGAVAAAGDTAAMFVPAGGYSLIDAARLAAVTQRQQQPPQPQNPSSTSAERPSQFDARRAQLIIDLQTNPPHPTPSAIRSPTSVAGAGADGGHAPSPATGSGAAGSGAAAPTSPPPSAPMPPPSAATTQPTDFLVQFPEGRELLESVLRYVPYVLLVAFKYMFDHMDGIINIALLLIMFTHANWLLKKQVSRQKLRSIFALVRELTYVTVVLLFVALMLGGSVNEWVWLELWRTGDGSGGGGGGGNWHESRTKQADGGAVSVAEGSGGGGGSGQAAPLLLLQGEWPLRRLLYSVLITDLVAKLCTVHVKICVTLLPPCAINFRNRGRIYLFIEGVSQMVRSFLPVLPWLVYLLSGYEGYDKIFGVMLTLVYVVAKGGDILRATTLAKAGLLDLFKIVSIGVNPSKEQLQAAGDTCPICHDRFVDPMRLTCSHIFCEECVATWFDREPTCPLCRALVGDDPAWRDGATSHFLQFF